MEENVMKEDKEREERIYMEIIVDAHDEEERAMGWYYYLQDELTFPFKARVIKESKISPLKKDETVTVMELADEGECLHEIFVQIEWNGRKFGVPLEQLYPVDAAGESGKDTVEAVEDWHYWIGRGYSF
jgi:hypothetical protein